MDDNVLLIVCFDLPGAAGNEATLAAVAGLAAAAYEMRRGISGVGRERSWLEMSSLLR